MGVGGLDIQTVCRDVFYSCCEALWDLEDKVYLDNTYPFGGLGSPNALGARFPKEALYGFRISEIVRACQVITTRVLRMASENSSTIPNWESYSDSYGAYYSWTYSDSDLFARGYAHYPTMTQSGGSSYTEYDTIEDFAADCGVDDVSAMLLQWDAWHDPNARGSYWNALIALLEGANRFTFSPWFKPFGVTYNYEPIKFFSESTWLNELVLDPDGFYYEPIPLNTLWAYTNDGFPPSMYFYVPDEVHVQIYGYAVPGFDIQLTHVFKGHSPANNVGYFHLGPLPSNLSILRESMPIYTSRGSCTSGQFRFGPVSISPFSYPSGNVSWHDESWFGATHEIKMLSSTTTWPFTLDHDDLIEGNHAWSGAVLMRGDAKILIDTQVSVGY